MRKEDLLSRGLYTSKYKILHRKMHAFFFLSDSWTYFTTIFLPAWI